MQGPSNALGDAAALFLCARGILKNCRSVRSLRVAPCAAAWWITQFLSVTFTTTCSWDYSVKSLNPSPLINWMEPNKRMQLYSFWLNFYCRKALHLVISSIQKLEVQSRWFRNYDFQFVSFSVSKLVGVENQPLIIHTVGVERRTFGKRLISTLNRNFKLWNVKWKLWFYIRIMR